VLTNPEAALNPFYFLAPEWGVYPLVILATTAAVIASQALIAGAFSLTMQAIQLGYFPRLVIQHTSHAERGQIYMPQVNWTLMLACVGLVIGFGSSSNLAAAYGIAVSLTMVITTCLFYFAARHLWGWSPWLAGLEVAIFLTVEVAFLGANGLKIGHGGWFPIVVGAVVFTLMSTWKTGRKILRDKLAASSLPYDLFLSDVKANPPLRVPGTAVFMSGSAEGTPVALLHNLKHNKVLHDRVIILTVATRDIPYVNETDRLKVEKSESGFYRIMGYFGFMEEPNVPRLLQLCQKEGIEFHEEETTFFLSRETIIPTRLPGMALWRERLFATMSRNAQHATTFFRLPVNRVVELGMQVEF
jgi:KUP system potassium uptake protein